MRSRRTHVDRFDNGRPSRTEDVERSLDPRLLQGSRVQGVPGRVGQVVGLFDGQAEREPALGVVSQEPGFLKTAPTPNDFEITPIITPLKKKKKRLVKTRV